MIYSFHGLYCWEKNCQKNEAIVCEVTEKLPVLIFAEDLCFWESFEILPLGFAGRENFPVSSGLYFFCLQKPKMVLPKEQCLLIRPAEVEEPLIWVLAEIATLVLMCNEDNRSKGFRLLNPVINSWVILEWSANLFKVFLQNSALVLLCFYILLGDKVCP